MRALPTATKIVVSVIYSFNFRRWNGNELVNIVNKVFDNEKLILFQFPTSQQFLQQQITNILNVNIILPVLN